MADETTLLSAEELAAIREWVYAGIERWHGDDVELVVNAINGLFATVVALQAENAALHEALGAIITAYDQARTWHESQQLEHIEQALAHARALLGKK